MIGYLQGVILEKAPPAILLLAGDVGYEVDVPMSTFYDLPPAGGAVKLFIHTVIREDAHLLFGFASKDEREVFRKLLKVSGVGPRLALAVLSGMSVKEFALVIANADAARLAKVPGIGKKTAERLLLELGGKISIAEPLLPGIIAPVVSASDEVSQALVALGYSEKEACLAVKALPEGSSVEDGIRLALKHLARV
ncbi:Holliday junction branch migration protein RuvA [Leeia sp. TBRC 13508]|uniref:Holliday junction branch migration complex subunit RuvA n=1 Tax=Leeia speluncae TaxID=2884804 RepID=A0ABS8D5I8_9NEIS|nr:Holliday junction branch migration protein RuvA [Leeia speluncae]MCB6183437.1 Holliday junction branch migration protein RuvA [Leeia speluncae]